MKNSTKAIIALLFVGLLVSVYGNYTQHTKLLAQQTQVSQQKEKVKAMEKALTSDQTAVAKTQTENQKLETENTYLKNNDKGTKETSVAFQETTKKLFEAMTNFDEDTYGERKQASEPYLSEDLVKQFFPDSKTLGDSNGTESQLTEFHLYGEVEQGKTLKGLVLSRYESKGKNSDWNKGLSFYEVEYNPDTKKIEKMQYLGDGLTGDMLE